MMDYRVQMLLLFEKEIVQSSFGLRRPALPAPFIVDHNRTAEHAILLLNRFQSPRMGQHRTGCARSSQACRFLLLVGIGGFEPAIGEEARQDRLAWTYRRQLALGPGRD
jgi:hypothetical protein